MTTATLIRHPQNGLTFGVLVLDTGWSYQTLELPWANNAKDVSCIPDSLDRSVNEAEEPYTVVRHKSPTRGECYAVLDVPGRDNILIHCGNSIADTQGCILVGLQRVGDRLIHSRAALAELFAQAPEGFEMSVLYA